MKNSEVYAEKLFLKVYPFESISLEGIYESDVDFFALGVQKLAAV